MIELLPIRIESTIDWSILFVIIAAITFFFGKIILEISPYRENKFSIYVSGATFLTIFVLFPPLILYTIFGTDIYKIPYVFSLFFQFILTWFMGQRVMVFTKIQRMNLKKFLTVLVKMKTESIMSKHKTLNRISNFELATKYYESLYFSKFPQMLLFIFAVLNYWFTASVVFSDAKAILMFLSLLFATATLSCFAVEYARRDVKYPQVTVHFESGEKLKGELAKIDDGFINIINGKNVYHIVESKVKYIQVEILSSKGKAIVKKKLEISDKSGKRQ